jgi:hypothetical protein
VSPIAPKLTKPEIRQVVDACLEVLGDDPPRFKRLLRDTAALLDDLASVLREAVRPDEARLVRAGSAVLRGAAYLPAGAATTVLRKAAAKALADKPGTRPKGGRATPRVDGED